jgi:hypothetical protein
MGYIFILLTKNLIAELLCSCGWYESLCMVRSAVVGFLYTSKVSVSCVFLMVMSK